MGREPTWQLRVLDEHLCSSQIFAARTVHFSSISVYMGQGGSGAGHGVAMVWPWCGLWPKVETEMKNPGAWLKKWNAHGCTRMANISRYL